MSMSKFVLSVDEGSYAADSFGALVLLVLRHRLGHLLRGEGWRD